MNGKIRFLITGVLLIFCQLAIAQVRTITGKVVDGNKNPMPGVSVLIKGTSKGIATDFDGLYSIEAKKGATLVFSYVGFTTKEVKVGSSSKIDIVLKEDAQELGEVVVVGFGTQKKVNLTGAVSTVDSKTLEARPVTTAVEAIQGLVPGLNVGTSNSGGQLNTTKSIDIRGVGTIGKGSLSGPLVLIDGMEGNINALNPNDIENISVLKDAAAASIYGSRAPFGVILVTTKKGRAGKTTVNFSTNVRLDSPINRPKMLDSYSWALYFNDADVGGTQFSEEKLQQIKDFQEGKRTEYVFKGASNKWEMWDVPELLPVANTNWIEEHYKKQSFSYDNSLSINGGNEKIQYYLSANYLNRDGLFRYADESFKRYTLSAKIKAKLNNNISIGYSTRLIRQNYEAPSYLTNNSVFYHDIIRYWPIIPLKDPNGYYTEQSKVLQLKNGGRKKDEQDWIYNQLSTTVNFTDNWNLQVELNYRVYSSFNHQDYLTVTAMDANQQPYVFHNNNSSVSEYVNKQNFFNPNIYTNYSLNLDSGHNFKFMAGFQSELLKSRDLGGSKQGIITPDSPTINTSSSNDKLTKGGYGHWATAGFFGRVNYNYKEKYLLELNGRYDGTSRFLKEKRWNFFPSVSLGWNLAQESFWDDYRDSVSSLKIRGSWGELGNQNTNNWYPFYQVMGYSPNAGKWILGETKPNVSSAPGLVSSSLTWETIRSWNIGLDLAALRNRLSVNLDYFRRYTLNMVGPAPELPHTLGTEVPRTNNADMVSYGFEANLSWRDRIGDDFHYGISLLLSDSQQKILKYPNPSMSIGNWYNGRYTGEIWGYTTVGIAKTQEEMDNHLSKVKQNNLGNSWSAGDIMYKDINGDGEISAGESRVGNSGDKTIIGNSTPRYNFGVTLDAAYKSFDFKVFLQGVGKRDFAPGGSYFWGANGGKWQTVGFVEHLDYFRDDTNNPLGVNLDSYYPRADWGSGRNHQVQTKYLQDASYVRVKNIQLGYTLSRSILDKLKIKSMRVYVSGENVMTFTKLSKLYDPEMLGIGYGGEGVKTYPLSSTWSLGLSLTL